VEAVSQKHFFELNEIFQFDIKGSVFIKRNGVNIDMLGQSELGKNEFIWILLNFNYAASSVFSYNPASFLKLICTILVLMKLFFPKQFLNNISYFWS